MCQLDLRMIFTVRRRCQDAEIRMTMPGRKISSLSSKRSASTDTNQPLAQKPNEMIDHCIHFYNHDFLQLKLEKRRLCDASPKTQYFLPGLFCAV